MTKIFVVVCHDRHVDDDITVHLSRETADAKIEKFKAEFSGSRFTWTERNYGQPKWCRFVDTHDEGPYARIEIAELLP